MSQRIVIDSSAFARDAGTLEGDLPVARLERVLDLLADSAGSLSYRVTGSRGTKNRPRLLLKVDGVLSLCCQRCLEGIAYSVALRSVLEFVADEDDLTQEELEDDSCDFLPLQSEVDVLALIEDEIILGLPPVPRHDSCAVPGFGQETEKASPFSVLKSLRGRAQ